MHLRNYLIFILFLIGFEGVFAQEFNQEFDRSDQDSVALSRRREYEETLKRIKENERRRKANPQRYADSIARVKEQLRFRKATDRLEEYKSANLEEIKEIDLTGARLKNIPDWIFEAEMLEILVLDHNQINILPKELQNLKHLRRIYWRYNDLVKTKPKIPRLEGIEKLDLTGNDLTKLPKIHRLKGLEELVLEDNEFNEIPTWRGRRLKTLKELDLSLNPIEIDKKWYGLLDHIEILKLNKCKIDALHPSLFKITGLTELQIQINELDSIPVGISALTNLSKLSFYKNNLNELPFDFFDLEKLVVVDLYYNDFEKIPDRIGELKNLEILYLSFNKLYDIPESITKLSKLEQLYIHHNRLSEIPQNIGDLGNLRILHFQNNYIPSFPSQILQMNSLVDLDISDTDIRSIPSEITALKLKTFYWRNLEINLNTSENEKSRNALMKLMENGTKVVPPISLREITSQ